VWGGFEGRVVASDSHGPPRSRNAVRGPVGSGPSALIGMPSSRWGPPIHACLSAVRAVSACSDRSALCSNRMMRLTSSGIVDHPQDRALCVRGDRPGGSALRSYRAASAYSSM
jgi:hypothetical protein